VGIVLAILVIAGGFAVVLSAVAWLGARIRRRGIGGGLVGPLEEVYNPAAHRYREEVRGYEQRLAPSPAPGDRLWGGQGPAPWSG
jgi:hypothetical protein